MTSVFSDPTKFQKLNNDPSLTQLSYNNNNTNYLYSAKVMYELFIYRLLPPPQAFQKNKIGAKRTESYASLRLKFQITTCERTYSLRVVWPAEEVVPTRSCRFFLSLYSRNIL
jgi:hypothetical protein